MLRYLLALIVPTYLTLAIADNVTAPSPSVNPPKSDCSNVAAVGERMNDPYSVIADRLAINHLNVKIDVEIDEAGKVLRSRTVGTLPEITAMIDDNVPFLQCKGTGALRTAQFTVAFEIEDDSPMLAAFKKMLSDESQIPEASAQTIVIVIDKTGDMFLNQVRISDPQQLSKTLSEQSADARIVIWGDRTLPFAAFSNVLSALHQNEFPYVSFDINGTSYDVALNPDMVEDLAETEEHSRLKPQRVDVEIRGEDAVYINGKLAKLNRLNKLRKKQQRIITLHVDNQARFAAVSAVIKHWLQRPNTWLVLSTT